MNIKYIAGFAALIIGSLMFVANVSTPWFLASAIGAYFFIKYVVPFVFTMFNTKEAFSSSMVFVFVIGAGVMFVLRDFDIVLVNSTTAGIVFAAGIALYVFKGFDVVYGKIRNFSI